MDPFKFRNNLLAELKIKDSSIPKINTMGPSFKAGINNQF